MNWKPFFINICVLRKETNLVHKHLQLTLLFYLSSGLGYIVGSLAGAAAGNWRWGLRITPILGAAALVLIYFFMQDPPRGHAEDSQMKPTSYGQDVRALIRK